MKLFHGSEESSNHNISHRMEFTPSSKSSRQERSFRKKGSKQQQVPKKEGKISKKQAYWKMRRKRAISFARESKRVLQCIYQMDETSESAIATYLAWELHLAYLKHQNSTDPYESDDETILLRPENA